MVTSPMYKQAFDLVTGECLDLPGVSTPVHPVRVYGGFVAVDLPAWADERVISPQRP